MTIRRLLFVSISALILVLGAAACGSDGDSEGVTAEGGDEETTGTTQVASASGGGSTSSASPDSLEVWQADLKIVGCYGGAVDGELGPKTEQAIRSYQTAKGLTVDGQLGPETDAALAADAAASTVVCTSGGSGTQASQASADELQVWQSDLNIVGCYAGPVDGTDGPLTEAAVHAFQAAKGLTVDGALGPQTRAALEQAAAAGETVCTNTSGGGSGTDSAASEGSATLAAASYNKAFTLGRCSLEPDLSNLSLSGQADNLTLVADAVEGAGTVGVSGGTESDGITVNGNITSVSIGADRSFTASGTFSDPNFAGETFSLTGSC